MAIFAAIFAALPVWLWAAFLAGLVALLLWWLLGSSGAVAQTARKAIVIGRNNKVFEAFWQVAGREESRNRLDDWREVKGRWASIGWMHFSQGHSIHLLMQAAAADDLARFNGTFGEYADNLRSESWVKSANLNNEPLKSKLKGWLGTVWGEKIQRQVAKQYYFDPTMAMMNEVRDDASDVYKVVAASTRIFMAMDLVRDAVRLDASPEAFSDRFERLYKEQGNVVWNRFPRQLKNAKSMLASGQLAIR